MSFSESSPTKAARSVGALPVRHERFGRFTASDRVLSSNTSGKIFVAPGVTRQYFGYLRSDPNAGRDTDFTGYNFWLDKVNTFNGDFAQAEMVTAFIESDEYRQRFLK